ncbi:hypothetical protein NHX12_006414 [Muraenolepis orangiensis]|uniref:Cadherin domain-containing protein n=1 Tax=Muraenolepis orangiensis TaxID=630683 RepID=A0A9Q0DTG8_9TELE|nr:hypothetical protein NHX12_006414 [Muraenolepis orangiensis]
MTSPLRGVFIVWSGSQAEYSLEGEFPEMLFTVSMDGLIYLNAPLDRETQDQFQISIVVERPDGREMAEPVELRVMVGDANDNRPTFPQAQYHTVVKELAHRGTEILTVQAADNDDPKTDNVRIFYRLAVQVPETPRALFRLDRDSGVISVQADSMEDTAPQYTLTITAEDAKGLNSSCTVVVTVQDENNNAPYGPYHVPEDAVMGTTVTAVEAGDADVRGGDSWQVNYRLESGNEEDVFSLAVDRHTNQSHYEVTVREGEEPGRVIATIRGHDPDSHPIRYSLRGDTKRYFSIGKYSGELKTVQALDREENSTYTMEVLAVDGRNASLSASTLVTVQILDVNDNSPVLVGDYSWKYLCTPRWEEQALVLASRDSDGPQHGGRLNFSLRSDATVRRNWKLTPINDTHTNLSLNIPYLAPEVYTVPFTISDSSSPPRSTFINLPGTSPSHTPSPTYQKPTRYLTLSHTFTTLSHTFTNLPGTSPSHTPSPTYQKPTRYLTLSHTFTTLSHTFTNLPGTSPSHTPSPTYQQPTVYLTLSHTFTTLSHTFSNLPVTVCPCNVRGYCKIAAKQLQGTILVVVFVRLSYQSPKGPSQTSQERVPLNVSL